MDSRSGIHISELPFLSFLTICFLYWLPLELDEKHILHLIEGCM